jgi:ankyrin repeat protein
MNYRQTEIRNARTKSCTWILNNEAYVKWVEQTKGVLWIKGKPGSGKSTLMKKIFQLLNDNAEDSPYCLSYFFHRRGGELQHTELGMFRTLLYQLFKQEPELGTDLQSLFEQKQKEGKIGTTWDWSLTDLRPIFRSALTKAAKTRPYRVFIDALDEGGDESARSVVSYLYDLEYDLNEGGSSASICFSCRHYPILGHNDRLSICVEDENYDDIALYIGETLERVLVSPGQNSTQDKDIKILKSTIAQKSSGVFLWAVLVTQRLAEQYNEGKSLEKVLETLKTVPVDIGEVYRHILTAVLKPQDLSESLLLFQVICLATRPLSIEELRCAMAFAGSGSPSQENSVLSPAQMTQRIISLSGGLAEVKDVVNNYPGKTQFIHQSVTDFLVQDRLKCLAPHTMEDLIAQGHSRLSQACIKSLKLADRQEVELPDHLGFPHSDLLIPYAVKNCFHHVQQAEKDGFIETQPHGELGDNAHRYLEFWIRMYGRLEGPRARCPASSATMLHVAACYSLHSTCRILLENGADVDAEDKAGNRPIYYAARYGDHHIGALLLDAGTSVGKTNNSNVDPLTEASLSGNADLVRLLLRHGAKVSEAALMHAVGCESVACVELLLQHEVPIDMTDLGHGNVLFMAVGTGKFQIIRQLMDHYREDINVDILNELLNAAAGAHNIAVVQLILDCGAMAKARAGWLGSPLLEAILVNRADTVKLLLEHGADINFAGRLGSRNALEVAKRCQRSSKTVKLLVDYGAEDTTEAQETWPGYFSGETSTPSESVDNGEIDELPSGNVEALAATGVDSFSFVLGNSIANWSVEATDSANVATLPSRRRMSI